MPFLLKSPGLYKQGFDILRDIDLYTKCFGDTILLLISDNGFKRFGSILQRSLVSRGHNLLVRYTDIADIFSYKYVDLVLGIGGGSILDKAKDISDTLNKYCVLVPTVCSNDGSCTSMIVTKDLGINLNLKRMKRNPDLVFVDTKIIRDSPYRYLLSGLADAFSKYYESYSCDSVKGLTMTHNETPRFLLEMSKDLNTFLINNSQECLDDIRCNKVTTKSEEFILKLIYQSGILADNCGLSVPHAFGTSCEYNGYLQDLLHGEKISIGLLLLLAIKYKVGLSSIDELLEVHKFFSKLRLPVNRGFDVCSTDIRNIAHSLTRNRLCLNLTGNILSEDLILDSFQLLNEIKE